MSGRLVEEPEFAQAIRVALAKANTDEAGYVTGPGRSGAIAAVYVSHILRIPFLPFGHLPPLLTRLGRIIIADTARQSGRTVRKAMRKYEVFNPIEVVAFEEPPRVFFWYEACNPKPQRYRHEDRPS